MRFRYASIIGDIYRVCGYSMTREYIAIILTFARALEVRSRLRINGADDIHRKGYISFFFGGRIGMTIRVRWQPAAWLSHHGILRGMVGVWRE